ncbi:hypothetical protein ACWGJT_23605 [Streptomyces xantholiticus]
MLMAPPTVSMASGTATIASGPVGTISAVAASTPTPTAASASAANLRHSPCFSSSRLRWSLSSAGREPLGEGRIVAVVLRDLVEPLQLRFDQLVALAREFDHRVGVLDTLLAVGVLEPAVALLVEVVLALGVCVHEQDAADAALACSHSSHAMVGPPRCRPMICCVAT